MRGEADHGGQERDEDSGVRTEPRLLRSIQACRGLAALLVVLFHATGSIFALEKYYGARPFANVFEFGNAGVDFFFVLSGFIILRSHRRDIGRPGMLSAYLWKRFRRIYPTYWVAFLAVLGVFLAVPSYGLAHERELLVILQGFLLTPFEGRPPLLAVAWTLQHELLFYVLFGILIWRRWFGMAVFVGWLALTAACFSSTWFPLSFLASLHHVQFLLGMGAALVVERWRVPVARTMAFAGGALFVATGLSHVYTDWLAPWAMPLSYGVGATLLLVGLVEAERSSGLIPPRALERLGEASYSIYLIHFPALSFLAKATVALGLRGHVPVEFAFVLVVAGATIAGIGFYRFVEEPLLRALPRKLVIPVLALRRTN